MSLHVRKRKRMKKKGPAATSINPSKTDAVIRIRISPREQQTSLAFLLPPSPAPLRNISHLSEGTLGPAHVSHPRKKLNKKVSGEMYHKGVRIGAEKFEKMDRSSLLQTFSEGFIFTPVRFTRYTFCPLLDAPRRSFQSPPPPYPPPDSHANAMLISRLSHGDFA